MPPSSLTIPMGTADEIHYLSCADGFKLADQEQVVMLLCDETTGELSYETAADLPECMDK